MCKCIHLCIITSIRIVQFILACFFCVQKTICQTWPGVDVIFSTFGCRVTVILWTTCSLTSTIYRQRHTYCSAGAIQHLQYLVSVFFVFLSLTQTSPTTMVTTSVTIKDPPAAISTIGITTAEPVCIRVLVTT